MVGCIVITLKPQGVTSSNTNISKSGTPCNPKQSPYIKPNQTFKRKFSSSAVVGKPKD